MGLTRPQGTALLPPRQSSCQSHLRYASSLAGEIPRGLPGNHVVVGDACVLTVARRQGSDEVRSDHRYDVSVLDFRDAGLDVDVVDQLQQHLTLAAAPNDLSATPPGNRAARWGCVRDVLLLGVAVQLLVPIVVDHGAEGQLQTASHLCQKHPGEPSCGGAAARVVTFFPSRIGRSLASTSAARAQRVRAGCAQNVGCV